MGALCFLVDLLSLTPSLLEDLKQCLLELANYYAISPSQSFEDRIGLCYVFYNHATSSNEMRIAYNPNGASGSQFNLRDFHYAVKSIPLESSFVDISQSQTRNTCPVVGEMLLSDRFDYSWSAEDVIRKVIVLTSSLPQEISPALSKAFMDAADKCIAIEVLLFETKSSHLCDVQESIRSFATSISDMENCSIRICSQDCRLFQGMARSWLLDLKDEMEEPMQARFIFKNNLSGSVNQIFCNFVLSIGLINNVFTPCTTCKCHGTALVEAWKDITGRPCCPVTGQDLGCSDVIRDTLIVGEKTVLSMPYSLDTLKRRKVSPLIDLHVIERTNLASLNEGLLGGTPYLVTPSTCHETGASLCQNNRAEMNTKIFQGLCFILHTTDQALVCSSDWNSETMADAFFPCYYILQPSSKGPMLLRRIAGSEEILPLPHINNSISCPVTDEIRCSIQASINKIESRNYDPVLHVRGFHQKVKLLVEESLQFGSIPAVEKDVNSDSNSNDLSIANPMMQQNETNGIASMEVIQEDLAVEQEEGSVSVTEEWEQLVNEVPMAKTLICTSKLCDDEVLYVPPPNQSRDNQTSKILERLELPKKKVAPPIIVGSADPSLPTKPPSVQFQQSHRGEQASAKYQLLKPIFHRLKRK